MPGSLASPAAGKSTVSAAYDYMSLIAALKQRSKDLKLTFLDLEADAQLPDGYVRCSRRCRFASLSSLSQLRLRIG